MIETTEVFGDWHPFILVHEENMKAVAQFLRSQKIAHEQATVIDRLYKLSFPNRSGDDIRRMLAEMQNSSRGLQPA